MTQQTAVADVVLEPAAQAFVEATANPPFLPELGPVDSRKAVNETQSGEIFKPPIDDEWITVQGGRTRKLSLRIVRPQGAAGSSTTGVTVSWLDMRPSSLPVVRLSSSLGGLRLLPRSV